jgi:hypothetical protein
MFVSQRDAGLPAARIATRNQAAIACLRVAARDDRDREFLRGYADSNASDLTTLRNVQHSRDAGGRAGWFCWETGSL